MLPSNLKLSNIKSGNQVWKYNRVHERKEKEKKAELAFDGRFTGDLLWVIDKNRRTKADTQSRKASFFRAYYTAVAKLDSARSQDSNLKPKLQPKTVPLLPRKSFDGLEKFEGRIKRIELRGFSALNEYDELYMYSCRLAQEVSVKIPGIVEEIREFCEKEKMMNHFATLLSDYHGKF